MSVTGSFGHRRTDPTYVARKVDHVERGKVVTPPGAMPGKPNRKAGPWRDGSKRSEEANAVL